jgi:hypothetical protein
MRTNIRNRDLRQRGGHVYTSLVSDMTYFKPGEVKTLQISADEVAEIKRHKNGAWELTSAAPTPEARADDDEEMPELTSSEASMLAAEAEADRPDERPRVPRVARRTQEVARRRPR